MNKKLRKNSRSNSGFCFECSNCGKKYDPEPFRYLCPECSVTNNPQAPPRGILKILYDYERLSEKYHHDKLFDKLKEKDFVELLPIRSERNLSYLKVGKTPLYRIRTLKTSETKEDFKFELYLKDDSQNPTFSFKDRASDLVSAFARENGISKIVTASTGNAGSSLAGICASQQQQAIIIIPAEAPKAKLIQSLMYGARVIPVIGNYDQAFDLSIAASEEYGWFNRNTAYNPLTIEGKKIVSFEIFQQLRRTLPDRIFVPVGDGVILSGVYKGFEDLKKIGLISKIPIIVAVQASGSDNLLRNLNSDEFISRKSATIADSISVDIPRNFHLAKDYLNSCNGESITVDDDEIITASVILARSTGIFTEPASAACLAGFLKYKQINGIEPSSRNVVLLTGSGLKDLDAVNNSLKIPTPLYPELANLSEN